MAKRNGKAAETQAPIPVGINHVVLNVRNLDESHKFWTEIVGFKQTGEWRARAPNPNRRMRFYSGSHGGKAYHHDIALVENPRLPPPPAWGIDSTPLAINHIAVALPGREAWLAKLEHLQQQGVKFHRRVNHGMTHSVYISDPNGYGVELLYELPREVWEGDIDEALNYVESAPLEGEEALADPTEYPVFGKA